MSAVSPTLPPAPVADRREHQWTEHGVLRPDPYAWLRDDSRTDPAVLAHLEAENGYADAHIAGFAPLRDKLLAEMIARLDPDESSVPYRWRNHYYYRRFEAGLEYPMLARKAELEGPEQLLLDVNLRAVGKDYYDLGGSSVSPNERLLAIGEDCLGRRIYRIQVLDLATGETLADSLENTEGDPVWANDNLHLFYIAKDPVTLLGNKVYRHRLGTPQSEDVLVYEETDDSFFLGLDKTLDDSRILLYQQATLTSEVSLLDADAPLVQFQSFLPRQEGHEYSIAKLGEHYWVLSNHQAPNFRVFKVAATDTDDMDSWLEVWPHASEVRVEDILLLNHALVLQTRERGATHIHTVPHDGSAPSQLSFDEAAYVTGLGTNLDPDATSLRIWYSSLTTPDSVFDYCLKTGARTLLKQLKLPPEFSPALYHSERLWLKARDGAEIPVSLVYRRGKFKGDGSNPLYLYGYGAYGHVVEPDFSAAALSLLDRGLVYAIVHVRGGEMLGRAWYDAGRLFNKRNSFTDFIDATQGLLALGYGDRSKVVASGASAGGLLMGAVANMAPELYLAMAAHVPFVDIVSSMLDETLPLTTNEYDEWGDPNDRACFDYMLSYSPYDNISRQAYPHLLVTTGLHDSQVQYFEPAKWVARLREMKTDANLLLFKTDMDTGHGGKSGRYRQYEDTALEYAFFLHLLGLD
ncbi:S9 family peptidase [Shewanella sedimentimangrovi]|uniref:S9 family peptidase n=1 Tax=Shewanella sedimentimangrovi TaxID=2814293 RepID=A0ABX7R2M0_9GAMM|nr:S9 family peptidase [Shewanella sedimentimangrovi]QSX37406.1 S9 family peptidase [Shewanella sedimentimangrovi]